MPDIPGLASNLVLLVTYSMVGWFLARTQVARRPLRGGWSVSGISLAAIFPTCALAHVVSALVSPGDVHTLLVDGYQIPRLAVLPVDGAPPVPPRAAAGHGPPRGRAHGAGRAAGALGRLEAAACVKG